MSVRQRAADSPQTGQSADNICAGSAVVLWLLLTTACLCAAQQRLPGMTWTPMSGTFSMRMTTLAKATDSSDLQQK